jgi:DNA-binding transcriptional LysR family regulator
MHGTGALRAAAGDAKMRPMNIRQIEAFQAIMDTGSTIAAAERLGLSQSAVSRLLAQFEEDLGLRLFVRQKGRLVPSPEAQALMQDAAALMEATRWFRRRSEQLRVGGFKRQLLKISLPTVLATAVMPALARRFAQRHPDVVMEVLTGSYRETERALLAREADLGLVRLPTELPGIAATGSVPTELTCIMPRGHALEQREAVHAADLDELPLILMGRQRFTRQELDMAMRQARVRPKVAAEVHSVGVACSFVAQGLGVAIVNAMLARYCTEFDFSVRPFEPRIGYTLGIATLEGGEVGEAGRELGRMLLEAIGTG